MSLLDDVSIVVTPNGYKAGELYAVIPVPTEGAEEVTNGDFTELPLGTGWDAYTSSSSTVAFTEGAVLSIDGSNSNVGVYQQNIFTSGVQYKIVVSVKATASFDALVSETDAASSKGTIGTLNLTTSYQDFSFYYTGTGTWDLFIHRKYGETAGQNQQIYVKSVSVKEWTGADMDVTRATAATRVDENGLVNYAEVLGSEQVTGFTNGTVYPFTTFTTSGNNITSAIVSSAFAGTASNAISVTSGEIYKVTFDYTKNSGDDLRVVFSSQVSGAGSQISNNELISASGSYTKYFTITSTTTGYLQMGTGNSGHSLNVSISNISVKEVTRDNVPRIDYTGGGCPHILAEPQRTNLVTYSEDFSEWTSKINIEVTLNNTTSPEGVVNAAFINEDNDNAQHFIGTSNSFTSGQDVTVSVFAKKNQRDVLQISPSGSYLNTSGYANYDLTNGLVTASGGGLTAEIEALSNGWYRCIAKFTATTTATGTLALFLQNSTTASRGGSYDGDGSSGLYLFGGQVEAGSYPTSYIPTSGSTVTRNQDIFTRDGIGSLINSTEGVLFVEASTFENGADCRITLSDGTVTNRVSIEWDILADTIKGFTGASGTGLLVATGYNQTSSNKIALSFKQNDFKMFVNGDDIGTDITSSLLTGMDRIEFSNYDGTNIFEGKVKQLQVYTTSLTPTQLIALTS